ncbi:MAG: hypothetical protein VB876_16480 [Pirellulales bacterium]
MSTSRWVFSLGLMLLLPLPRAVADEPAENALAEGEAAAEDAVEGERPAEPQQIAELIKQLNDDRFAARQDATRKLTQLGKDAIEPLAEAAQGDELEVTTRAFSIFEKLINQGDAKTSAAVRAALTKLAESKNDVASSRAAKLLAKAADPQNKPRRRVGGPIRIGGNAQIQIRVQAVGGQGVRKIQIKNVNGVKDITVEEGGKKIAIKESPKDGIKVQVTEKNKDGKEETKKYEAKNADELKKKHPEAHKLYEKYSNNKGFQIKGIGIGGVVPIRPPRIQIGPNGRIQIGPPKKAEKDGDEAEKESEADEADEADDGADDRAEATKQKVGAAQKRADKFRREAIEKQVEQLQRQIERLKQIQKNLDQPE